ncbi:hybrid sensor histidine kinase/response regulator [Vibrio sp. AK197]
MVNLYQNLFIYPKAMVLTFTSLIVITWVGYFYLSLKERNVDLSKSHYKYYLSYSSGLFFWILSNAYFHSGYLVSQSQNAAIFMAIFANLTAFTAFASAFLFSCKLKEHYLQKKTPRLVYTLLTALTVMTLGINLIPELTVQSVDITAPSVFVIHFGNYTSLFFFTLVSLVLFTLLNLVSLRGVSNRLSKTRVNFMVAGMIIFMVSTGIIQLGFTLFWGDFSLTWLPPALSISEMIITGYALITSRFYSTRYMSYLTLTAIVTCAIYTFPLFFLVRDHGIPYDVVIAYSFVLGVTWQFLYSRVKQYTSLMVYNSPQAPTERIYNLVSEFQKSPPQALQKLAELLNVPASQIQLVKKSADDELFVDYFNNNQDALIIEELQDKLDGQASEGRLGELHDKMHEQDAAIIMPMFDNSHVISHLLIATHKSNGQMFSNEELIALKKVLEQAQYYINSDRRVKQSQALANSIAHEMRNPLAQLQLHFEKLQIQLQTDAPVDTLLNEVENGKSAIRRGKQLIDIILREVSSSSLSQEPMAVSPIKRLLLQAINQFGFESEQIKRRIHLHTDVDFSARVNDTLFNFVVFNLLRNAIYYFDSYPESRIDITTISRFHENVVVFRDSGPGIPQAIKNQIFDDFFSHNKSGGSGLGLGYCARVMQSFGGTIQCHSEYGQYTEFHLIFPALSLSALEETEHQDQETQELASLPIESQYDDLLLPYNQSQTSIHCHKTVLVVDDKEVQRAMVTLYLQQLGYDVIQANNGKVAVEIFQNNPIDLVMMDIQMPVMNGFEAATRIKQLSPNTPVIALSGESGERELDLITSLMDGRLSKPTTKADLRAVMSHWIADHEISSTS